MGIITLTLISYILYMPRLHKNQAITTILNQPFNTAISELYLQQNYSAQEISNWLFEKTKILVTTRHIQRCLKELGIIRTYSNAFNLAIKRGRKTYDSVRKPIKSFEFRSGINLKTRYLVFKRDKSRCVLCGVTAKESSLVIDHILPVVKGGTNDIKNLRILCRACNHGKMIAEERI